MRRVYKNLCLARISVSIMAANMWEKSLKNVESDNNKILYETLEQNGIYFLNKLRICMLTCAFSVMLMLKVILHNRI